MEKPSLSYTAGGNVLKKKKRYNSKGTTPMEGNLAVGNKMTRIYLAFNHITSPILNYKHTSYPMQDYLLLQNTGNHLNVQPQEIG